MLMFVPRRAPRSVLKKNPKLAGAANNIRKSSRFRRLQPRSKNKADQIVVAVGKYSPRITAPVSHNFCSTPNAPCLAGLRLQCRIANVAELIVK